MFKANLAEVNNTTYSFIVSGKNYLLCEWFQRKL
jgi:hypothetical protein